MTSHDKTEFKKLLVTLGTIYKQPIDSDVLDVYFGVMGKIPMVAVRRAFTEATAECLFFPKPVELRGFASSSEPPPFREVDGHRVFACLTCDDRGTIMELRGKLGWSAYPCSCLAGQRIRASWETPDSTGHIVARSAKLNAVKIREWEASEAEAARD